jgi:stage V sporulation protein G
VTPVEITEVKVFLKNIPNRRLKAYATVTFDNSFVVRNVKVVEGNKGLFVAMPSRKIQRACPRCRRNNPINSRFCNYCGVALDVGRSPQYNRQMEHQDIAHPINQEFRSYLENKVLEAYNQEIAKLSQPQSTQPAEGQNQVPPQQ